MMEPSVAQAPSQPSVPEQIQPPVITTAALPGQPTPAEILAQAKIVAKAVKLYVKQNKSQKLVLESGKYVKRETWQFCAACYQHSAMVTRTEPSLSDKGEELGFIAIAHVVNAQGRVVSGAEGACMYSEPDWAGKPSFQLLSMSSTRACNKALSNVFGWVMVIAGFRATPAEEMDSAPRREITTPCDKCGNKVTAKRRASSRKKYGASLCLDCEKKEKAKRAEAVMNPIQSAEFVEQSIQRVREKKANGAAQPIAALLDITDKDSYAV